MLANQLSLPENRARETIGAAACSAGVRIVDDSVGSWSGAGGAGRLQGCVVLAASYGFVIIAN